MSDNIVDVLPRCIYIMESGKMGIGKGLFPDSSEARDVVGAMMAEARETS